MIIPYKRSVYIRLIILYKKKKIELRSKYNKDEEPYKRSLKKINLRLRAYRDSISKIDRHKEVLDDLNNRVKYTYGFSLYLSSINWRVNSEYKLLVRDMFFNYARKKGVPNIHISRFFGWKDPIKSLYYLELKIDKKVKTTEEWKKFVKAMQRELPKIECAKKKFVISINANQ